MLKRLIFFTGLVLLSTSCKSQPLSYISVDEIDKNDATFNLYSCEQLTAAAKSSIPLKNLAGIRAAARCKDFKFDPSVLTDFEKRLYVNELASLNGEKPEVKNQELSEAQLLQKISKEKSAVERLKLLKQLRAKQKRVSRRQYLKTTGSLYTWAVKNFKKEKKSQESAQILYEAAQLTARTYWTEDFSGKAEKTLNESISLLKEKNSVAELLFLLGRIDEEAQKTSQALARYDQVLEDIKKYSPKSLSFGMDRLLWLKAWILYKEKKYDLAEPAFAELAGSTQELSEKSKAQFYQARCLRNLGQELKSKELFESITQNDFFGYYGLVSYRELGKKLPAISKLKAPGVMTYDLKLSFLPAPEKAIFTDLAKYREFNLLDRAFALLGKSRENELNMALFLAQENKVFMPLFRTFSKLENSAKVDVFVKYPDLIFPQPYSDQVKEMAEKTKLPSSLIYSIMKQESGFNEKARSHADAMGLMQVVPKLAKRLSKKFEIPYSMSADLYNPQINIRLGSYELMEQVQKQKGQLTFVAAAYNAGPGALSNWLKNRNRQDILEFIEEIPYDETRTYVKLIARNQLFYERVSNRDNEHDFPSDFLN